jgi:hypothetical protein
MLQGFYIKMLIGSAKEGHPHGLKPPNYKIVVLYKIKKCMCIG